MYKSGHAGEKGGRRLSEFVAEFGDATGDGATVALPQAPLALDALDRGRIPHVKVATL